MDRCNWQPSAAAVHDGADIDLFDEPGGLSAWLAEHDLSGVRESVEGPLRQARAALRRVLEHPGREGEQDVNTVLSHGAVRYALRDAGAEELRDIDAGWAPAWRAVANYLELLQQRPDRIRRCANPICVLYFYDTSRNGTRRWCSMEGCGSRVKMARHYQRHRASNA